MVVVYIYLRFSIQDLVKITVLTTNSLIEFILHLSKLQ